MLGRFRLVPRARLPLVGLFLLMSLLPIQARPAAAHPLGNFTVNLYSRLELQATELAVTYVVDMAEIPTFQEFGSTVPDEQARATYLHRTAATLRQGLRLQIDGRPRELVLAGQEISFPAGQGDLATTRIDLRLTAPLPRLEAGARRAIAYEDTNFMDRLGWREVVVAPRPGIRLLESDAPTEDRSDGLRVYPQDLLQSPPDQRTARLLVTPGAAQSVTQNVTAPVAATRAPDRLAALIATEQLTPLVQLLALLVAVGLGALHALSPGHGKTIVGAYLVGARGTARHALFLGITVTITHTLGVFALGLITLYASRYILPEQLFPWLGVASGALVVAMGLILARQRWGLLLGRRPSVPDHTHAEGDAHHHPGFAHEHGPHTHTHLPPGANGTRLGWRSLLALGVSGGLIPCPSALVVLLSAISLGRVGFGLLLIVAFSVGLAGVLTGIGLLFVYGARLMQRAGGGWLSGRGFVAVPLLSALVVTMAGVVITGRALVETGLIR